jgi:hypothetical protein
VAALFKIKRNITLTANFRDKFFLQFLKYCLIKSCEDAEMYTVDIWSMKTCQHLSPKNLFCLVDGPHSWEERKTFISVFTTFE